MARQTVAGWIGVLVAFLVVGAGEAQIVAFNSFGAGDTFSTTSPRIAGRPLARTTVVAARFTTTTSATINSVQVALGPTTPAGQPVTVVARLFGHSTATGLPTSVIDTMASQRVLLGAPQVVTFTSTQFLETFSGTVMWLVISMEEPVASGETVQWNTSPSAMGNVALSSDGDPFVNQGTVALPAFKVIGEVLNGACCNTATGQCMLTGRLACTQWSGFTYSPGQSCSGAECAVVGACCTGVTCAIGTQASCGTGRFLGPATACQAPGGPNPCCRADINGFGGVSVQDLFDFLALWFAGCP